MFTLFIQLLIIYLIPLVAIKFIFSLWYEFYWLSNMYKRIWVALVLGGYIVKKFPFDYLVFNIS
jgi:hypothetical protein